MLKTPQKLLLITIFFLIIIIFFRRITVKFIKKKTCKVRFGIIFYTIELPNLLETFSQHKKKTYIYIEKFVIVESMQEKMQSIKRKLKSGSQVKKFIPTESSLVKKNVDFRVVSLEP